MDKYGNRVAFTIIGDIGHDRHVISVVEIDVCHPAKTVVGVGMVADKVEDLSTGSGGEQDDNGREKEELHDEWFRWLIVDGAFGCGTGVSDVYVGSDIGRPEK